jgi:hypothetical protein
MGDSRLLTAKFDTQGAASVGHKKKLIGLRIFRAADENSFKSPLCMKVNTRPSVFHLASPKQPFVIGQ